MANQNDEVYFDIFSEVCDDDFDVDSGSGSDSNSDIECNPESPVEFYGNRILPIDSLTLQIKENLCCKSCHENSRNEELYNFIDFLEQENLIKKCSKKDKEKFVSKFLENKVKESRKKMLLTESTIGIATRLNIFCPNCEKVIQTDCERSFNEDKDLWRYNGSETYAINTMLVLGLQQIGGGGSDAMKLLTFLNLPNGKSIKDSKFKRIEDSIGNVIRNSSEISIKNALEEEIQLTLQSENRIEDYDKWKRKELDPEKIGIVIAYDMGWNKRSTGTRYDSTSGHGVAIGQLTKKIVGLILFSKKCSVCDSQNNRGKSQNEIPKYKCVKNHDGTSKAMESRGIYNLFIEFWDTKKCGLKQ